MLVAVVGRPAARRTESAAVAALRAKWVDDHAAGTTRLDGQGRRTVGHHPGGRAGRCIISRYRALLHTSGRARTLRPATIPDVQKPAWTLPLVAAGIAEGVVVVLLLVARSYTASEDDAQLFAASMTATAVIAVAVLTIWTTDRRQVRQLQAARAIANLDDLRDVLQHGLKAHDAVVRVAGQTGPVHERAHADARAELRKADNRMRLRSGGPGKEWCSLREALEEAVREGTPKYQEKEVKEVKEKVEAYTSAAVKAIDCTAPP